jgi:WD40 repeat protein
VKIRSAFICFLLSALSACSTQYISKTETPAVYSISGIPLRPGAVSWSPDSSRLAVIKNEELVLFNYTTGTSAEISGINPVFIEWAPGSDLLAVSERGDMRGVVRINMDEETRYTISVEGDTEAVKWLSPPDDLIALSTEIKRMKIGTFMTYELRLLKGIDRKVFFQKELYFPTLRQDLEFTSAWLYQGIRPVYETVLTPEYHNPPALPPYTYFKTVDPISGLDEDIMKLDSERLNVLASWSPDGSRLSVANDEGLLIIADSGDAAGSSLPVNYEIKGVHPSWNPKGSQIYLGGWLIRSDGKAVRELLSDAVNSIGLWSPDGEKLAVMTESKTFIFDSIHPSFHAPDRPLDNELLKVRDKLRMLKELLKDGLILKSEFHERSEKLFEKIGGEGK